MRRDTGQRTMDAENDNRNPARSAAKGRRGISTRDRLRFLLLCIAIVALARPVWHWGRSTWTRINAGRDWQRCLSAPGYQPQVGDPCAWLAIEKAGVDSIVLLGDTKSNLVRAPVMHSDTGRLTLLSAHRDMHFKELDRLQIGDTIKLEGIGGTIENYIVAASEVVSPEEAAKLIASKRGEDRLLLMSCYPFEFIGPAPQRYLLWADKKEK